MRTERVLFVIILLGFILKLFGIPGGNIISVICFSALSIIYFPFGFYFLSEKSTDKSKVTFSILAGISLSTLVIGNLFKLMQWSGAYFLLIIGLIICLPIAIISILKFSKSKVEEYRSYYKKIVVRVIIFIVLGLFLLIK